MGIGRRKFLQFVGVALAGAAADPLRAVTVHNDYYVNRKLGLGFRKPAQWYFDSFKDFGYLRKGQQLSRFDRQLQEEIKEMLGDPLAIISKYSIEPEDTETFTPAITIYYGDNEEMAQYDSFDEYVETAVRGWEAIFTDYQLLEAPEKQQVSACDAMRFKARFLFEHDNMEPTPVDKITYLILQEHGQYTIHLFDSPYTGEDARQELSMFIESLHIL